jgi:hypothetical protein
VPPTAHGIKRRKDREEYTVGDEIADWHTSVGLFKHLEDWRVSSQWSSWDLAGGDKDTTRMLSTLKFAGFLGRMARTASATRSARNSSLPFCLLLTTVRMALLSSSCDLISWTLSTSSPSRASRAISYARS